MFKIRPAQESDVEELLQLIKELAIYEKMLDAVVNDHDKLYHSLFIEKCCHAILLEENNIVIGFALYFFNYSTFAGKKGLYLEDLFIRKPYRNQGYGTKVFKYLANVAISNNCARFEWTCLNWNVPSLKFYEKLNAVKMSEWITHRLNVNEIKELAEKE